MAGTGREVDQHNLVRTVVVEHGVFQVKLRRSNDLPDPQPHTAMGQDADRELNRYLTDIISALADADGNPMLEGTRRQLARVDANGIGDGPRFPVRQFRQDGGNVLDAVWLFAEPKDRVCKDSHGPSVIASLDSVLKRLAETNNERVLLLCNAPKDILTTLLSTFAGQHARDDAVQEALVSCSSVNRPKEAIPIPLHIDQ